MAKAAIIIPAYNVDQYVHRAIESAINQTEQDVEIVVIDDGSTDTTASVVEEYAHKDPRIVFCSKKNGGVSSARNLALDKVTADYVLFLDSDDWLEENAVERLLANIQEGTSKLVCAECYHATQADDGSMVREYQGYYSPPIVIGRAEALHSVGKGNCFKLSSSCYRLYDSRIIKDNDLRFNESIHYGEDGLFVFQYLCLVDGISYFSEPLWNILDRPGSATKAGYNAKWLGGITAVDLMLAQKGIDRETKEALLELKASRAMLVQMVGIRTQDTPLKDILYARAVLRENIRYAIKGKKKMKSLLEVFALTTFPIWLLRILLKK